MITALLKLFSTIVEAFLKALNAFLEWVMANPKTAACIAVLIASVLGTYFWTKQDTEKKVSARYDKVVAKYKENETALNAKIVETEKSSKEAADKAKVDIDDVQKKMLTLAGDYELKLVEEKKKRTVTIVQTPDGKVEVVTDKGEVICNRFPDAFLETWNGLIDLANGKGK